jgi:hypothetical protein
MMSPAQDHGYEANFCVSWVSERPDAFYAITWRSDEEPPELCCLVRRGPGNVQKTDNSTIKLLIIIMIVNPFDLACLMR